MDVDVAREGVDAIAPVESGSNPSSQRMRWVMAAPLIPLQVKPTHSRLLKTAPTIPSADLARDAVQPEWRAVGVAGLSQAKARWKSERPSTKKIPEPRRFDLLHQLHPLGRDIDEQQKRVKFEA